MSGRRKTACAVLKARGVDVARHLRGEHSPKPPALDKPRAALLRRDAALAFAFALLLRERRDRGESVNAESKPMVVQTPKGGQTWSAPTVERMFRLVGKASPPQDWGGRRRVSKQTSETSNSPRRPFALRS